MNVLIQTENKSIKDFPEYYICKNGDIYSKKNYNNPTGSIIKLKAHRITGINQSNISACCRNKRNSAGGFQWKYARWNKGGNNGTR